MRSVTVNDQLPDFVAEPGFTLVRDYRPAKFDNDGWKDRVRKASKVFSDFPALRTSVVEFSVMDGLHRFVNSEGTEVRDPRAYRIEFELRASAQAPDGMIVRDSAFFYTHDLVKMVPESEVAQSARGVGETVMKIAAAPLGENYSGPILFRRQAMACVLLPRSWAAICISPRKTAGISRIGESGSHHRALSAWRGVRIMPEFFDAHGRSHSAPVRA